ncbi:hypothetical protein Tco_0399301 [Tanacetum coccineum]
MFPQRHVAGEKVGMLLGKASNVVVSGQAKGVVIEQIVKDDRVENCITYSDELLHSQYHKKCLVTTDSLTISHV